MAEPAVPTAPPTVEIDLDPPWAVVEETPTHLVLRRGDKADGARVQLRSADGWSAGVAPIARGLSIDLTDGFARRPLVQPSWDGAAIERVTIATEGPDLVVKLSGPPLRTLIDHPEAPEDPALAWVRLRPRPGSWRVATTGLITITLPGDPTTARVTDGLVVRLDTAWGAAELTSDAPRTASALGPSGWTWSTRPSLDDFEPYPTAGLTLFR